MKISSPRTDIEKAASHKLTEVTWLRITGQTNLKDLFQHVPGDGNGELEHYALIGTEILIYPQTISDTFDVMQADEYGIYQQQGKGQSSLISAMLAASSLALNLNIQF